MSDRESSGARAQHAAGDEAISDGRAARAERSRRAIADALFDLVRAGHLEPTAQQVANQAEVGIRTVFRLFSDMEALYATLDDRLLDGALPLLLGKPPRASIAERATMLVEKRGAFYERIAPFKRASNLKRARSPFIAGQHAALLRKLRMDLTEWFPELAAASPEMIEALDQACSFEAWDRMRTDQKLGVKRSRAAMKYAVSALLARLDR